jgi:uncharacterized protein (DUF924 family)
MRRRLCTMPAGFVRAGHDQATGAALRPFFYLPFEHAEDAAEQARSVVCLPRWAIRKP